MRVELKYDPSIPPGPATAAHIQQAIDRIHHAGGGTLSLAPGHYLSTTVQLRPGIELHLQYGAILQAWPTLDDYPQLPPAADNKDQSRMHLLAAFDCTDIAVTGPGIIDGNDRAFWVPIDDPAKRMYGIFRFDIRGHSRNRPSPLVQFVRCRNLRLDGFMLRAAPGWALHVFECDTVSITSLTIRGDRFGPHTDGIGINASRDVRVAHCDVDTGDDAIIIKATNSNSICRNITVTNCIVASNCAGLGLGADVCGQVSDVVFTNCIVKRALRMIQVEMWFPGQVRRALFSSITGQTLPDEGIENERPIYVDIQEQLRPGGDLGEVQDMVFRDILCQSRGRIILTAQDGATLDGISLDRVIIDVPQIEDPAITIPRASSLQLSNHNPHTRAVRAALIADNVHRLTLRDVEYRWPDQPTVPMHALGLRNVTSLIDDSPRLVASRPDVTRIKQLSPGKPT